MRNSVARTGRSVRTVERGGVFEGCSTVEQRWRAVFDSVRPFECSFDRLIASVRGVELSRHPGDPPYLTSDTCGIDPASVSTRHRHSPSTAGHCGASHLSRRAAPLLPRSIAVALFACAPHLSTITVTTPLSPTFITAQCAMSDSTPSSFPLPPLDLTHDQDGDETFERHDFLSSPLSPPPLPTAIPAGNDEHDDGNAAEGKGSVLWQVFEIRDKLMCCTVKDEDAGLACTWTKPRPGGSATTQLWRHLERWHPKVAKRLRGAKAKRAAAAPSPPSVASNQSRITQSFKPSRPSLPAVSAAQQQHLSQLLFNITVECNLSFRSLTGSPAFQQLMREYVGWKVPSRATLSRALPRFYSICLQALKQELHEVESISITTDSTYLTQNNTPFIAVTGHWVDATWTLHDRPLAVFPTQQSETAEYIRDQLKDLLQRQYHLSSKVHCIVTDEGANFIKGGDYLGRQEVIRERIRCACHRIQLAFKEAIEQKKRGQAGDSTLFLLLRRTPTHCSHFQERVGD